MPLTSTFVPFLISGNTRFSAVRPVTVIVFFFSTKFSLASRMLYRKIPVLKYSNSPTGGGEMVVVRVVVVVGSIASSSTEEENREEEAKTEEAEEAEEADEADEAEEAKEAEE